MDSAIHSVLDSLAPVNLPILLNIPFTYQRFAFSTPPKKLAARSDIRIFRPSQDYGPATKLLGALEYLAASPEMRAKTDAIITFDDDAWYPDPALPIAILSAVSAHLPRPSVVTFGGTLLQHSPFRKGDGILNDCAGYVDAVKGFSGVLYPAELLKDAPRLVRQLASQDPETLRDDDALFGVVCGMLDIPVFAVPRTLPALGFSKHQLMLEPESADSAVDMGEFDYRKDVESRIYTRAVASGHLPNRSSRRQLLCDCEACRHRRASS